MPKPAGAYHIHDGHAVPPDEDEFDDKPTQVTRMMTHLKACVADTGRSLDLMAKSAERVSREARKPGSKPKLEAVLTVPSEENDD